jgi:hypothetical protein
MKEKKTYKELKDEYKREFERVIIEMEEFRDNTKERSSIREFEVPLPPRYLIDKKLKTKTYMVYSLSRRFPGVCDGPQAWDTPYCLDFHEGCIKQKNIKKESLFRHLSRFIPERLFYYAFYFCFEKYDMALKTISERRHIKKENRTFKEL